MTKNETMRMQIGLKLDAQKNSQLNNEELRLLSVEEIKELRASVAAYLTSIDSVGHEM